MLGWWHYRRSQKISLVQLQNLVNNQIPFYFFSLLPEGKLQQLSGENSQFFSRLVALQRPIDELEELSDKMAPLVILCKSGGQSARWARKLEKRGYINVYVVEQGIKLFT